MKKSKKSGKCCACCVPQIYNTHNAGNPQELLPCFIDKDSTDSMAPYNTEEEEERWKDVPKAILAMASNMNCISWLRV